MAHLSGHVKGLVVTTAGVLILSPDSLLVRLVTVDPWTLLFWRGLLIAIGFAAVMCLTYGRRTATRLRAVGRTDLAVAVFFAAGAIFFISALAHTSVANTLVIVSATPLFAALMARAFLGEPAPRRTWTAMAVALVGIVVIVSGSLGGGALIGDLSALASAAFLAAIFILIRRRPDLDMVPAMTGGGLLIALAALPLASPLAVPAADWPWLAIMGLLVMPLATWLMMLGPRYLPAPEVSLILLLETVLGPLWVWLALGEEPGSRAILGGAIVVGALLWHAAVGLRRPVIPASP